MTQKWPHITSSFSIRDVVLPNRLVFQPHMTHLGRDGRPSEDDLAYYAERAAGGVGLIIFGSQAVHATGRISDLMINAWDRNNIPAYTSIVSAVQRYGTRFFSQLTHCGPDSLEQRPSLLWGPSPVAEPSSTACPKEMELEDIQEVVVGFANSASNMREAGFDGVEVKVGHDGLLRAFASPYLNRRADRYGGSLEGRLRLTIETLRAIREAVGADFVVGARVCLQEYTPWGYDLEYGLAMAAYIEASGLVDYLNCDAGTASSYWAQIPPAAIAEGSFRRLNAELKKRSQLPIISYGRVKHPDMAEAMIAGGEADLIGMARQLIADPQTPRKIAEGRGDDIRFCTASNDSCIFEVLLGKPIRCDHNPAAGREKLLTERHMRRSNDVKTVMVVGGGPAGMKVAETLSRRGHHVMLFEREKEWGGQIALAGRQPYHVDILEITDYLERVLRKQRVEMYLGVSVRPEDIGEMDADAIVLATGSRPRLPRHTTLCAADGNELRADMRDAADLIGSVDEAQVASVDDVLRARIPTPRKAAIIDGSGHWDAAGTAEFLCNQGTEVWIITHRHMAGAALEGANRALFYERIAQKDIHIITSGQVAEVCAGKVTVRDIRTSHATVLSEVDIVVPVVGRVADDELYVALKQHGERRRVYRVGDCVAPRLVRATISEAYEFARQL